MKTNPDIVESPIFETSRMGSGQEYLTAEELMARLERADTQIDEGHYMEHEAAKQHFQSRMAMKSAWL